MAQWSSNPSGYGRNHSCVLHGQGSCSAYFIDGRQLCSPAGHQVVSMCSITCSNQGEAGKWLGTLRELDQALTKSWRPVPSAKLNVI